MKYFLIISIIFLALFTIILSKVISKRMMYNIYYAIDDAHANMLYARRIYYQARFIKDEAKRKDLQNSSRNLYVSSVSLLDSEFIAEQVNKMPEAMKEKCLEKINSPRYELF